MMKVDKHFLVCYVVAILLSNLYSDRFEQNVHAVQLWAAYMHRVIVDEDQRLTEA